MKKSNCQHKRTPHKNIFKKMEEFIMARVARNSVVGGIDFSQVAVGTIIVSPITDNVYIKQSNHSLQNSKNLDYFNASNLETGKLAKFQDNEQVLVKQDATLTV